LAGFQLDRLVGGLLANTIEAGFLGGIVAGLLAGAIVVALKRIPAKGTLKRMMPILVYPIVGVVAVGLLMLLVIGEPVAAINQGMGNWLQGLSGANAIVLGALLGAMMAFDMGGPVNKVAYAFATGGIAVAAPSEGALKVMAAVMAAGMVPPLAMALATVVLGAIVLGGFFLLFQYTKVGVAMRATAFDQEAALAVGIPVTRVYAWSWMIAAVLATIAGVFLADFPRALHPGLSFVALRAFPAAIVGCPRRG
jgi:branched-subunit amino acid ABC-type transport system permease component